MIVSLFLGLGLVVIAIGIIMFLSKKRLYRNGIRAVGKIVGIETYTYLTQGPEFNTLYYTVITPIIEVEDNGKNIRVAYYSIEDCSNLSAGDEVDIIYPKGRVYELIILKEKEFYKESKYISLVGVLILLLSLVFALI